MSEGIQDVAWRVRACDAPMFDLELFGYWMFSSLKPGPARDRELRRQIYLGVVHTLRQVRDHGAQAIVGFGQGAVMAWLVAHGPIRDLSFKARSVAEVERSSLMAAWNSVRYLELLKPRVGIQNGGLKELLSVVEVIGEPDQIEIKVMIDKLDGQREEGSFIGRNSPGAQIVETEKGRWFPKQEWTFAPRLQRPTLPLDDDDAEVENQCVLDIGDEVRRLTGETRHLEAARQEAETYSSGVLARVDQQGAKIHRSEILECLRKWGFGRNTARQNVTPEGHDWVHSENFGMTRDKQGQCGVSRITHKYPHVMRLFCKWLRENLPTTWNAFKFTSINVNKGYAAPLHRDGSNLGPSVGAGFGNYVGGRLNLWESDELVPPTAEDTSLPIELMKEGDSFDGRCLHEAGAFGGEGFSLIWLTHNVCPDNWKANIGARQ